MSRFAAVVNHAISAIAIIAIALFVVLFIIILPPAV